MDGLVLQISISLVLGILGWVLGRFSVKTKVQEKTEELDERVKKIETGFPLVLKCQLVQLVALKNGKVNGECEEVLKELNDYFYHK